MTCKAYLLIDFEAGVRRATRNDEQALDPFTCFRTSDLTCTIGEHAHSGFLRSFVIGYYFYKARGQAHN